MGPGISHDILARVVPAHQSGLTEAMLIGGFDMTVEESDVGAIMDSGLDLPKAKQPRCPKLVKSPNARCFISHIFCLYLV